MQEDWEKSLEEDYSAVGKLKDNPRSRIERIGNHGFTRKGEGKNGQIDCDLRRYRDEGGRGSGGGTKKGYHKYMKEKNDALYYSRRLSENCVIAPGKVVMQ